ncbi:MAG: hypothetical protein ACQEWV_06640 [Bacillota bacterium]
MKFLKILENFENADKKTIDVTYILCTLDEPNSNGAIVSTEEAEKSYKSIIGKPLIIVADVFNSPTGHDQSAFPKLTNGKIIGTHTASEINEIEGKKHIVVTASLYKLQYPEIVEVLLELHERNELKFSYELEYQTTSIAENGRLLKDLDFIASCVVSDPANIYSISLEVANIFNYKSDIKLSIRQPGHEGNWLNGLEIEEEKEKSTSEKQGVELFKMANSSDYKQQRERTSESFLDGIDAFDKKINQYKQDNQEHRKAMKKLLGPGYRSPSEEYEEFNRKNGYLKDL